MRKTIFFTILGVLLGLPLSYYLQPDFVQSKVTLTEYLTQLGEIATSEKGDFLSPIILSCFLSGLVFGILGYFLDQSSTPQGIETASEKAE